MIAEVLAMFGLVVAGLENHAPTHVPSLIMAPRPSLIMPGGVQEPPGIPLNASTDHIVDVFNGGANLTGFFPNRTGPLPPVLNSTLSANGTTTLNYVVERILSRANVSVGPDVKEISHLTQNK
ncbi:hypothetical protein ANCCAN_06404 [Ancylostoma caninum]|uniref:Uncharacterized protein n=1 Tax=Ancylostoma caninum TaxID=29170 RepID=A0A368GWY1_ANCCA|nr:hypothetical protein ANCCAN_06404 [Ancylostoma caninum]